MMAAMPAGGVGRSKHAGKDLGIAYVKAEKNRNFSWHAYYNVVESGVNSQIPLNL